MSKKIGSSKVVKVKKLLKNCKLKFSSYPFTMLINWLSKVLSINYVMLDRRRFQKNLMYGQTLKVTLHSTEVHKLRI